MMSNYRVLVYACVLFTGIQMTASSSLQGEERQQQSQVLTIAHRGNSINAPENTLAAFKQALELGVDFIEFDVHLSKDGIPVVVHDPHLFRTVNLESQTPVQNLTVDEIRTLDAGAWFDAYYAGEKIPLLQEVFELTLGKTGLMIEIKTGSATEEALAFAVVNQLKQVDLKVPVYIGSFSPKILEYVRQFDSNQKIIAIMEEVKYYPSHEKNVPDYYAFFYKLLDKELIERCKFQGAKVWTFTVDHPEDIEYLIDLGVDGIISNDPKKAIEQIYSPSPSAASITL